MSVFTLVNSLLTFCLIVQDHYGNPQPHMESEALDGDSSVEILEASTEKRALSDASLVEDREELELHVEVPVENGDPEGEPCAQSGRLSSIMPTLGRVATTAHKLSAPYLGYAAMASQEAARCSGLLTFSSRWCQTVPHESWVIAGV